MDRPSWIRKQKEDKMTWIATLITFLLGYGLCWITQSKENQKEIVKLISRINPPKVGSVKPLTQEQVEKRRDKSKMEGDKAMEETLDELTGL